MIYNPNRRANNARSAQRATPSVLAIELCGRDRTDNIWRNICQLSIQTCKCDIVCTNNHSDRMTIILKFATIEICKIAK